MKPTDRLPPPGELLAAAVDPTAEPRPHSHVYVVFDDGEICLTKCGEVFGQRRLHLQEVGWRSSIIPDSGMETPTGSAVMLPRRYGGTLHTYAAFDEATEAYALRSWLLEVVAGKGHGIPTFREGVGV